MHRRAGCPLVWTAAQVLVSSATSLGHIWGMAHRTTRGTAVCLGHPGPAIYLGKCSVPAAPSVLVFFLTQKRSWELCLGITVETTTGSWALG